jgi:hypothetical protein
MKFLQILNAVFTAAGATFMVTLGVVAIMYSFYLGEYPRLQSDFRLVLTISAISSIMFVFSGLTFLAVRQRWRGWWLWQGANYPVVALVLMLIVEVVVP